MNATFLLSGAHCGAYRNPGPSDVTLRSAPAPSAALRVNSYSPLRSLQYASVRPSGDHRGYRSATPELRVTSTTAPRSAGNVMMSPRASNATRLPVGDTDGAVASLSAFAVCARSVVASVTTRIDTSDSFSVARLNRCRRPPARKTIESGPIDGNVTSK